jgi:hypothetical protein
MGDTVVLRTRSSAAEHDFAATPADIEDTRTEIGFRPALEDSSSR